MSNNVESPSSEDVDLLSVILSIWMDDRSGNTDNCILKDTLKLDPCFDMCPVGLDPRGQKRYNGLHQLARSSSDYIRHACLIHVAASREAKLRRELARFVGWMYKRSQRDEQHRSELHRTMELMPGIDLSAILQD